MPFRAVVLLLSLAATLAAESRIVAVGDVHGDYRQFIEVLRSTGVVDANEDWAGGDTRLVQTGDVPDRGPDTLRILHKLMELEKQAKKAGGAVHALIGNHEAMNVYGDLRYVTKEEFAAFATSQSEKLRRRAWEAHEDQLRDEPPADWDAYRSEWMAARPTGYFEHRKAFDPSGELGRWITKHDTVLKLDDTLFLHGGISPKYVDWDIKDINKTIQQELRDFSKIQGGMTIDSEGPLWYRGLAQNTIEEEQAHVEETLASFGVKRIVIGHTPTFGAVWPRFAGKVILIDVGLSRAYGGRQAALVIEGDELTAIHRGAPLPIPETRESEELLDYVREAAALDPEPSPLEPLIEQLRQEIGVPVGR